MPIRFVDTGFGCIDDVGGTSYVPTGNRRNDVFLIEE